jgi:hypothetical protein
MPEKSKRGILDEFAEFLEAKTQAEKDDPGDFAVNLRTTDADGRTHELAGIPISQASRWIYDTFGIGSPPEEEGDGGSGGKGEGGKGEGGAHPIKAYFGKAG